MRPLPRLRLLALLAPLWVGLASCHDSDDVGDYTPPAGKGAIAVDNNTFTDIDVFIDGVASPRVKDGRVGRYDLTPGVHRVVLADDEKVLRTYAADIDVLEGRQTILEVDHDGIRDRFDVDVLID
jgi:hypothetical protein